ncbi:hypothetical protein [Gayadomonas joobiniege]|uniref:hypothetical protein n=1 Tax=Gayadomonas joobiniege TaxID=1234606 RepID=UPI00036844B5|nr:hypothetical protein [Gayadomonas joobiniege]
MDVFVIFYRVTARNQNKSCYMDVWLRDITLQGARINGQLQVRSLGYEIEHCYGELEVSREQILKYPDTAKAKYHEARLMGVAYTIADHPDNIYIDSPNQTTTDKTT